MRIKVGFGIFATRSHCAFAANAYGERFAKFARKSHGALAVNAHYPTNKSRVFTSWTPVTTGVLVLVNR